MLKLRPVRSSTLQFSASAEPQQWKSPSLRVSVCPSVCPSVRKVVILPCISFFWFFAQLWGSISEEKWRSRIFRQNPHFSILGQKGPKIAPKWGFWDLWEKFCISFVWKWLKMKEQIKDIFVSFYMIVHGSKFLNRYINNHEIYIYF